MSEVEWGSTSLTWGTGEVLLIYALLKSRFFSLVTPIHPLFYHIHVYTHRHRLSFPTLRIKWRNQSNALYSIFSLNNSSHDADSPISTSFVNSFNPLISDMSIAAGYQPLRFPKCSTATQMFLKNWCRDGINNIVYKTSFSLQ